MSSSITSVHATLHTPEIKGLVNVGTVKEALNVYKFLWGINREVAVTDSGQLQSSGMVRGNQAYFVIQDDPCTELLLDALIAGKNLKVCTFTVWQHTGAEEPKPTLEFEFQNPRLTRVRPYGQMNISGRNINNLKSGAGGIDNMNASPETAAKGENPALTPTIHTVSEIFFTFEAVKATFNITDMDAGSKGKKAFGYTFNQNKGIK